MSDNRNDEILTEFNEEEIVETSEAVQEEDTMESFDSVHEDETLDVSEDVQEVECEQKEKFDLKAEVISWLKIFVTAFIIATLLDNFIIINANVPSGSMENTIMTGDRMIGNRLAYIKGEPKRGDVIIFKFPDNQEENYVKRVIGLPGEKVTIKNAKIFINDSTEPLKEDYLPEEWVNNNDGYEFQVPANSYFVLGDNRNVSYDARFWNNTYVSEDAIIAKASVVYWPFEDASLIKRAEY